MTLQKLHPQGPPAIDPQALKRRQLQERRRTLQTISELSATETTPPDFTTYIANGNSTPTGRPSFQLDRQKTPSLSKRRSLPQYCTKPVYIHARSPPPIPAILTTASQRTAARNRSHSNASSRQEAGWNARRERARMQAEQALSGIDMRSEPSDSGLQHENTSAVPKSLSLPRSKSSQPYLRSYYSQQHSLRNSRSMTGAQNLSENCSSVGSSSKNVMPRDYDVDTSERTSTGSSSFRSSRESAMRRSHSSSSSQSFILQGVPPLPSGCAQPTNAYYSALHSHYHNGYPYQLPGPMYVQALPGIRASPLPSMRVDGAHKVPYNSYISGSPAPCTVPPHEQRKHVQKPRPNLLKSQTISNHQHLFNKQSSQSSIKSQGRRHTRHRSSEPTSIPPSFSTHHGHCRPSSSVQAPVKAHISRRSDAQSFDRSPTSPSLAPRAIPDRESLTKWKSEREEAKSEFNGMQRAKVKERVRRANELEKEKERELQKLGKGAEKEDRVLGKSVDGEKKERGCLNGWFGKMLGTSR